MSLAIGFEPVAKHWSLNPGMCQIISLVEPGFRDQASSSKL